MINIIKSADNLQDGTTFAKWMALQVRKIRMKEFHAINLEAYHPRYDNRCERYNPDNRYVGRTFFTAAGTFDEKCRRIGGYSRDDDLD